MKFIDINYKCANLTEGQEYVEVILNLDSKRKRNKKKKKPEGPKLHTICIKNYTCNICRSAEVF